MSDVTETEPANLGVEARLGHVIKRAELALISTKNNVLRDVRLTVPQYSALLALGASTGLTAAQLSRQCLVTPQTMATVLGNLETKGLITRKRSPVHSRVLVAHLTRSGRSALKRADEAARDVERHLAAVFEPAERDQLREMLERAITALRAYELG